jgi:acyl dehydratase
VVDRSHIGRVIRPHTATVEAGRLRLFAKATGETRPEYIDEDAARAAGFPGLPVPPTFVLALDMELPDPFEWLTSLGADLKQVLHGGERFRYFAPIQVGDRLTYSSRIADVVHKAGGKLTFVVKETVVTNQNGVKVAEMRGNVIVKSD